MSASSPTAQRRAALETLIDKGVPDLAPDLHRLLAEKSLRSIALRGLASLPHAATPRLILSLYPNLTVDEKSEAVATLASRVEYAQSLLDAVEGRRIPPNDLSAYAARQIYQLGDAGITARLRKAWGEVRETLPQKKQQIDRYKQLLTPESLRNANLRNGRLVYRQTCQQCHPLFGEGSKIGPDLTGSNRTNLDYLLSNILDPNAEIGRDYRMSVVSTTSGRILTGIVTERTPSRLTMQTATEQVVIAAADIDEVTESNVSMMPEGQFERLTRSQIRDLIAYLASAGQVPLPDAASE
jgi:putative heme-binding domain-containing protein